MIEIVDYISQMRGQFKARKGDEILPDCIDRLKYLGMEYEAAAFYHNDDILALACIFEDHVGMWQLIMGFADGALDNPLKKDTRDLIKALKNMLEINFQRDRIRRLQAYVKADCPKHLKFAEWMGFQVCGWLEKWGPDGSDYWLYARVKR